MLKRLKYWADSLGGPIYYLNDDDSIHKDAIAAGGTALLEALAMQEFTPRLTSNKN